MNSPRPTTLFILSILTMLLCAALTLAASPPTAPATLTPGPSSTFNANNYPPVSVDAIAGNITWLTITGVSQTRAWQGYWGNVTGYITLSDANNFTFYNWSAAEPRGYLYATLANRVGTLSWLDVVCFAHPTDSANFDTFYGITPTDYDNVSNTYNTTLDALTTPQTVYIVNNSFTTCPATTIWQNNNYQGDNFVNYLMRDTTGGNDAWVFGTIIENKNINDKTDLPCYNGEQCDFQLLVAENGHGTDTSVTPYYFWVDLSG
jgi:hypothetical protein